MLLSHTLEKMPTETEIYHILADGLACLLMLALAACTARYLYRRKDFKGGYACAVGTVLFAVSIWLYDLSGAVALLLPIAVLAVKFMQLTLVGFAFPVWLLLVLLFASRGR